MYLDFPHFLFLFWEFQEQIFWNIHEILYIYLTFQYCKRDNI